MNTPYIWIPGQTYKKHEDRTPTRQVEIRQCTTEDEFIWKCPKCWNLNTQKKVDVNDNHMFICFDCSYKTVFVSMTPIARGIIEHQKSYDIDQRPRILRYK